MSSMSTKRPRIWVSIKQQQTIVTVITVNSNIKGAYSKNTVEFDEPKFKSLEKTKKITQLSVAKALRISQSTILREKKKLIKKHTNAIKPHFADNKIDSLIHSLHKFQKQTLLSTHICPI